MNLGLDSDASTQKVPIYVDHVCSSTQNMWIGLCCVDGELREFLHGFYTAVKNTHSSSDGSKITSLCRSCVETWNSKNDGLWLSIVPPEVARSRSRRSFDGENARWRVRFHTSGAFSSTTPWYLLGCDPDSRGALAVISGPSVGDVRTIQVLDCPREKHVTRSVVSVEKTVELTEIV